MKTIKIFGEKITTYILQFHNLYNFIDGYDIVYTSDINDLNCDVLVVFAECCWNFKLNTNAKIKICFTGEPEVVYQYSSEFLNQFTDVITTQQNAKVNNNVRLHFNQTCLNYFIGFIRSKLQFSEQCCINTFNNRKKDKLISVVCSNKRNTPNYAKRYDFVMQLKRDIPELDVYGTISGNITEVKDIALRNYKYSIAIENCSIDDYWTEKISDCIYSLTEPIYYGCTNINKYFSDITTIDINNYDQSLQTIKNKIYADKYDIHKALDRRNVLLTQYSLISTISQILKLTIAKDICFSQ